MMKLAILAASAAVLVAPAYSVAQTVSPIEIEASRVTLAEWMDGVSRSLDRRLVYPAYIGRTAPESGYTAISFRIDAQGHPTAVTLRRSSGSSRLDSAAMSAVSGMQGLKPIPGLRLVDQPIRANIIFATDDVTMERLQRKANHDVASLARANNAPSELALTVSANPSAG